MFYKSAIQSFKSLDLLSFFYSPCAGLIADIKRKVPFYLSDYKDALHIQCLAAFVYVFLGTFTPNVTFGGLLGQATDQYMVSFLFMFFGITDCDGFLRIS